jgi:hypothetical protein
MSHNNRSAVALRIVCLALMALTSGCSNGISRQLLNDQGAPGAGPLVNSLVLPPPETMQVAVPNDSAGFVEETALPSDVPTLTELSSRPIEGIDAPKVGLSIEQDIASSKITQTVRWRGKRNADGVDLANSSGALCSGTERDVSAHDKIKVACSDGRIATVQLTTGKEARLLFREGPAEMVLLDE